MKGDKQSQKHTSPWTDFTTTRKNRTKGRFFENTLQVVHKTFLRKSYTEIKFTQRQGLYRQYLWCVLERRDPELSEYD